MQGGEDKDGKLWVFDGRGDLVPFEWGKGFEVQQYSWGRRIICSTDQDRMDFMLKLLARYPGPFRLTYILEDNSKSLEYKCGRYTAGNVLSIDQIKYFLHEFHDFLQWDGRHHLMIACAGSDGAVIYDQHDYFFVYGHLEALEQELRAEGFTGREYVLGSHGHRMKADPAELHKLMEFRPWTWSPLEATDTRRHRVGFFRYAKMKLRALWYDRTRRPPN